MKDLQQDLNIIFGTMQEMELMEKVLLEYDLDDEVKELIKIKSSLNKKYIEINNKLYNQIKKDSTK